MFSSHRRQRIIHVQTLISSLSFDFETTPSDQWTIGTLKEKLHNEEGIPVDQQTLWFNNEQLSDNTKLDVFWELTVRLLLRLRARDNKE